MNFNKNISFFYDLILIAIICISIYYGITYTTYHTDPWHWGVIVGSSVDYINQFRLFKDIHVLYGPGQLVIFKFINFFYEINYYTVGVITTVIYALNLVLIYLISQKFTSKFYSIVIIIIFFLLNNYPQTPWPDFYAGLNVTISIFFLNLSQKNKNFIIISSLFLVFAVVFRTTYLYSIFLTILIYLSLAKIFKTKISDHIKNYFIFFIFFFFIYLFILLLNDNFYLWLKQGILVTSDIIDKKELYGFDIRYIYLFLRFIYHFLFPSRIENLYLLIFFISHIILIYFFLKDNFLKIKILEKNNIMFFIIFGFAGLVQSGYQTDVFRILMASVSIFFSFFYLLHQIERKKKIFIKLIILLLLIPLIPIKPYEAKTSIFPTLGYVNKYNKHIKNKNDYYPTNIKFFGNHRFNLETKKYYNDLRKIICNYETIANYSADRTLGYICNQNSIPAPTISMKPVFLNSKIENKFRFNNINQNQIIIADYKFSNPKLKLIKIVTFPKYTRFTKSDLFRQTFDNKIFLYIKN